MKKEVICMAIITFLIVSVDSGYGQTYWAKTYGIQVQDRAYSIQQTNDGGYIIAGETASYSSGYNDLWVLKLDSNDDITWEKTYGGSYDEWSTSIQQTSDGGYVVAGSTESYGVGNIDLWVLKLDSNGAITWEKTYGGSYDEWSTSIQQTSDGGYVVAGITISLDNPEEHAAWVLKLDSNGDVTWGKTYIGIPAILFANSIQQTSDGGYIVVGSSRYFLVMKLNSAGNVTWVKDYGGSFSEIGRSVQQTSDGGYVVAGSTRYGAGLSDFLVMKLDSTGNITWEKTYGGTSWDTVSSVQQTSDGGYVVAGSTQSFGAGDDDFWVMKLNSIGSVTWEKTYGGSGSDNAKSIQQTSDGGYVLAGSTDFNHHGYNDFWVLKLDGMGDIADCDMIGTSRATVTNSSVSSFDESVSVGTWPIVVSNTFATVTNTNATTVTFCEGCTDSDSDGICDDVDVCPANFDPDQRDTYPPGGNGIGDACDCECDFSCDGDVDAEDSTTILSDFGRNRYDRPCTNVTPCRGDFLCDGDVDAEDITKFLEDFGRGQYDRPCPICDGSPWCSY